MFTSTLSSRRTDQSEFASNEDNIRPGSVLSVSAKKSICEQLKQIGDNQQLACLLQLASLFNIAMPPRLQRAVNSLNETKKVNENLPRLLVHMDNSMNDLFKYYAIDLLRQDLNEDFNDKDWSSTFLVFLSDRLHLKKSNESYVKGKICKGKIYWEYIREGVLMHRNHDATDPLLDGLSEFKMSYEDFLIFKNSGKRHGNVRITRQRFIDYFPRQQEVAAAIWEELRRKQIINDTGKLSPAFHMLSNQVIVLNKAGGKIKYPEVMSAIQSCLNNNNYYQKFSEAPDQNIRYRAHRINKKFCCSATGTLGARIQNVKTDESCSQLWDVTIYKELSAHRNTEIEKKYPHGKLNYDHIPSSKAIKMACDLNESSSKEKTWYAIAIPEDMHTNGETFLTPGKDQEDLGFLSNIICYIRHIKTSPNIIGLAEMDVLRQALGAFRYLYKRGLDATSEINLNGAEKFKVASEPSTFFHKKENIRQIDDFFTNELNQLKR